jgi:hypothetical protein
MRRILQIVAGVFLVAALIAVLTQYHTPGVIQFTASGLFCLIASWWVDKV